MKKLISLILLSVLILTGCGEKKEFVSPVDFYYPISQRQYDANATAIQPETREGEGLASLPEFMEAYLQGPLSESFSNPFPDGLTLVSSLQEDKVLYVTFSDQLATLSGLTLTLACCCIARTTMGLTGVTEVHISAQSALLEGQQTLIFNQENMQFLDTITQ